MLDELDIQGGSVLDCAIAGGFLYLAGTFTSVNGLSKLGFAEIDLSTGQVTSYRPRFFGNVRKLIAIDDPAVGEQVVVLGDFDGIINNFPEFPGPGFNPTYLEGFGGYASLNTSTNTFTKRPGPDSNAFNMPQIRGAVYHTNTKVLWTFGNRLGGSQTIRGQNMLTNTFVNLPTSYNQLVGVPRLGTIAVNSVTDISIDQSTDIMYIIGDYFGMPWNSWDISDPENITEHTWKQGIFNGDPVSDTTKKIVQAESGKIFLAGTWPWGAIYPQGVIDQFQTTTTATSALASPNINVMLNAFPGSTGVGVRAMTSRGGKLYVLGSFTHVNEIAPGPALGLDPIPRSGFAMFDTTTGKVEGDYFDFGARTFITFGPPGTDPSNLRIVRSASCMVFHQEKLHLFGGFDTVDGYKVNNHFILRANGRKIDKKVAFYI